MGREWGAHKCNTGCGSLRHPVTDCAGSNTRIPQCCYYRGHQQHHGRSRYKQQTVENFAMELPTEMLLIPRKCCCYPRNVAAFHEMLLPSTKGCCLPDKKLLVFQPMLLAALGYRSFSNLQVWRNCMKQDCSPIPII